MTLKQKSGQNEKDLQLSLWVRWSLEQVLVKPLLDPAKAEAEIRTAA